MAFSQDILDRLLPREECDDEAAEAWFAKVKAQVDPPFGLIDRDRDPGEIPEAVDR